MTSDAFARHDLAPGLTLRVCPTKRFKSVTIQAFITARLDESTTARAMVPSVLRRGCRRQTTMRKISVFLESLYGAALGVDVLKMGDRQILSIRLETVSDRYLPGRPPVIRSAIDFLHRLLARPVTKGNGLRPDIVAQERVNLRRYIEGIINDRAAYAHERCLNEMCRGEAYARYEYGRIEDLPGVGAADLLALHRRLVASHPFDLYVLGDVREEAVVRQIDRLFVRERKGGVVAVPPTEVRPGTGADREVVETMDVEQGKLVMGFRTGATLADDDIWPLVMYSGVLGGFPHSKLFRHVREGAGLAYSIHSGLDWSKGLMFLEAGIDVAKYGKALPLIRKQLAAMAAGDFSVEDLESTRKSMIDRLCGIADSPARRIHTAFEMAAHGRPETPDAAIAAVARVAREDIVRVAGRVKLETVYFLKSKS